MQSIDVDDSIVLSDLLRTGEASRLRRRAALRIDHSQSHHTTSGGHVLPGPPRISSPNIVQGDRSNWDSDSDAESLTYWSNIDQPQQPRFPRRHRSSRRFGPYSSSAISGSTLQAKDEYVYTLVCGSQVPDYVSDNLDPFVPSILPLFPPPSPSASKKQSVTNKTTGCGALVHLHAAPKSRFRMWTARTPASDAVVPLDGCYFDEKEASRFTRSQCGCVSEGVGCAVCGNPLGTRYTPCKSASEGFFCPRLLDKQSPTSAPPLHNDWSSPKPLHNKPNHSVYTFFSDAVTPTPSFSFPPPPVRPARSRSVESRPDSPPTSPPFITPERYMYSPYDEEESDIENNPPYIADNSTGWGWRSIGSPIEGNMVDANGAAAFPDPPSFGAASSVPRDAVLLDRFVDMPPAPVPEDQQQPWGISPPSPTSPLRTRTGRTARWSSIGRPFPSLSSGLGGGPVHDDLRPVSPLSFYDRQLMAASEREIRDSSGDVASAAQASSTAVDLDGEMVPWGSAASDSGTDSRYVYDADGEYKPTEYVFDR